MHECSVTAQRAAFTLLLMGESWQSQYLRHVEAQTGEKLSVIARKAGVSSTTLTRPANDPEHKFQMKLETLRAVQKATGIPFGPFQPQDAADPPDTFDVIEPGAVAPSGTALVPIYDVAASAGDGTEVGDYEPIAASLSLPPDYLRRITKARLEDLSIISVKGDSMLPTLKDDDIVMLDRSKTNTDYDGLFVLRFREALHVKRISRGSRADTVLIVSDNERLYKPQEYPAEQVQVIGKVIWVGGKV